jgi:hypothetical protein
MTDLNLDTPMPGIGQVQWHGSDDDGGPDVGILIGLSVDHHLWLGERSNSEGGGMGMLVYGPTSILATASLSEYDEIREVLEQYVAPALAALTEPARKADRSAEGVAEAGYAFDINGDLETIEAEPRTIEKDPFDWPATSSRLYMGTFDRRDQSEFKMHVGLWDAEGMSQNWPEVPNLRNTHAALNTPTTEEMGEGVDHLAGAGKPIDPTHTREAIALKPCPFCGNDGSGPIEEALHVIHSELRWRPVYDSYTVQCDRCTATMGYSDSEEEAIADWNTRALPSASVGGDDEGGPVKALIAWARDNQAFPDGNPGGSGRGHIDENARFKLRDMIAAIDAVKS